MAFLELPPEIFVEIFLEVHHLTDLLACKLVCRTFHQVFKDSTRLEYRIALERAGMINNSCCNLPTNTRIKMLRERERAWGHFDWKSFTTDIGVPQPSSPLHEVTSNAAVLGLMHTHIPGESVTTRGFQSAELASTGEGVSADWNMVDMGEDILDFGVAIEEHDLLAYVTKQVRVLYALIQHLIR
jgi:hypothetical protein